jgi:hypothetical protein
LFFGLGVLSEGRQMDNDKRTNIIFFMMIYFRLFNDNLLTLFPEITKYISHTIE